MADETPARDMVARSRRLIAESQYFIDSARHHVNAATQRLERVRNALQAAWLQRELRRRSPGAPRRSA